MTDEKYNGWTNYATWRVNLEMFDGVNFVRDDVWGQTVADFAEQLESDVRERIDSECSAGEAPISNSYAHAFIANVNWYEIAQSINETYELGLKEYD